MTFEVRLATRQTSSANRPASVCQHWDVLIDKYVPIYEVSKHHQVEVATGSTLAYRAVVDLDLSRSPMIRLLFALRGLPRKRPLTLQDMSKAGFVILGEEPGTEIVLGVTGRFWRARGGLRRVGPDEFASFTEPGYAQAAWNFRVEPTDEGRSIVSTETRVTTTDPASRRAFRFYWRLVGPFSGLIRRRALSLIRKSAESGRW